MVAGNGPDDDYAEIREIAATVARERYAPLAAEWDANRTRVPIEERRYLGELGWLGISLPEEYGGSGAPLLAALVVQEELAKQCRPAAFQVFEANTGPAKVISLIGTDEQKQRLLPRHRPRRHHHGRRHLRARRRVRPRPT